MFSLHHTASVNDNILQHNRIIHSIFYFYKLGKFLYHSPNLLNLRIAFL